MTTFVDKVKEVLNESRADQLRKQAAEIRDAANRAERKQDAADEYKKAQKLEAEADRLDPKKEITIADAIDGKTYSDYTKAAVALDAYTKKRKESFYSYEIEKDDKSGKWYFAKKLKK